MSPDHPQFGEKSRTLGYLVHKLKVLLQQGVHVSRCHHDDVHEVIDTINTFMIPRGYVHVDDDRLLHLVVIVNNGGLPRAQFGMQLQHEVDVIWMFESQTGIWNTIKDRTGVFESLCPMKCGGIPINRLPVSVSEHAHVVQSEHGIEEVHVGSVVKCIGDVESSIIVSR